MDLDEQVEQYVIESVWEVLDNEKESVQLWYANPEMINKILQEYGEQNDLEIYLDDETTEMNSNDDYSIRDNVNTFRISGSFWDGTMIFERLKDEDK